MSIEHKEKHGPSSRIGALKREILYKAASTPVILYQPPYNRQEFKRKADTQVEVFSKPKTANFIRDAQPKIAPGAIKPRRIPQHKSRLTQLRNQANKVVPAWTQLSNWPPKAVKPTRLVSEYERRAATAALKPPQINPADKLTVYRY